MAASPSPRLHLGFGTVKSQQDNNCTCSRIRVRPVHSTLAVIEASPCRSPSRTTNNIRLQSSTKSCPRLRTLDTQRTVLRQALVFVQPPDTGHNGHDLGLGIPNPFCAVTAVQRPYSHLLTLPQLKPPRTAIFSPISSHGRGHHSPFAHHLPRIHPRSYLFTKPSPAASRGSPLSFRRTRAYHDIITPPRVLRPRP